MGHQWGKRARRAMASARQNNRCVYCGCELVPSDPNRAPTLDHLIPTAMGGRNHECNTVAACSSCNKRKAARHPDDFIQRFKNGATTP